MRQWVEKGKRPVFTDGSRYRYVVKSQWDQLERLSVRDGFLVRRWILLPSDRETYVPDSERGNVIF